MEWAYLGNLHCPNRSHVAIINAQNDPILRTANIASWQSVYWALMAIMINSISQPSGKILGLPSSWNAVLKVSPIFCLAESMETGFKLLRIPALTRAAISTTAGSILRHKCQPDHQHNPTEIEKMQNNKVFRLAVFLLGALPQTIKLYSCHGILVAQILAAPYLISFSLQEALFYLGQSENPSDSISAASLLPSHASSHPMSRTSQFRNLASSHLVNMLAGLPCEVLRACAFFLTFIELFVGHVQLETKRLLQIECYDPMYPILVGIVLLTASMDFGIRKIDLLSQNQHFFLSVWSMGFLAYYLVVWPLATWKAAWHPVQYMVTALFSTFLTGPALIGVAVGFVTFDFRIPVKMRSQVGVAFFVVHILSGLLWFCYIYDAQSTYKPSWAEVLG